MKTLKSLNQGYEQSFTTTSNQLVKNFIKSFALFGFALLVFACFGLAMFQ